MNYKSSLLLGLLAVAGSATAQVAVDGIKGPEWDGVTGYHIDHDASAPNGNFSSVTSDNDGSSYDAYFRADANYVYGLVTETDTADPVDNFANVYLNVDGYRSTSGSNLGFEITNDDAFNPVTGKVVSLAGTGDLTYASYTDPTSGLTGIEFAIPWSFLTTDPLGLGFDTTQLGDRVTFRTAQAFGYTAAGYDASDPIGLNPNVAADRLGHVIYTNPTPEPMSLAPLGLGALALLRRRKRA